jgi:hypothetical protein
MSAKRASAWKQSGSSKARCRFVHLLELSRLRRPHARRGTTLASALAGNAKSDAERLFTYPEVGQLDAEAARAALVHPAKIETTPSTKFCA